MQNLRRCEKIIVWHM